MTYEPKPQTYFPHARVQFHPEAEGLTHQEMKEECDINNIMAKFEKTGMLEHRNQFAGQYGDFTNAPGDYQESLNAVLDAEEMFSTIPAKTRARFGNDPGAFLDFVSDPGNADEMVKMGLATKRQLEDEQVLETSPSKPPITPPKGETKPPATPPKGD